MSSTTFIIISQNKKERRFDETSSVYPDGVSVFVTHRALLLTWIFMDIDRAICNGNFLKKIKSTCDISNIYMSIFLSKNPHTHKIKFKDLHTGTLCIIYGGLLYQISSAMYWYNRESWSLTFTSECWFIGHGLGADITGRGVTKADTHKMVSMTTFVLFLFVLK